MLTTTGCVAIRAKVMGMVESHTLSALWNVLVLVTAFQCDLNSEQRSKTKDTGDVRALKKPGDNKKRDPIYKFHSVDIFEYLVSSSPIFVRSGTAERFWGQSPKPYFLGSRNHEILPCCLQEQLPCRGSHLNFSVGYSMTHRCFDNGIGCFFFHSEVDAFPLRIVVEYDG